MRQPIFPTQDTSDGRNLRVNLLRSAPEPKICTIHGNDTKSDAYGPAMPLPIAITSDFLSIKCFSTAATSELQVPSCAMVIPCSSDVPNPLLKERHAQDSPEYAPCQVSNESKFLSTHLQNMCNPLHEQISTYLVQCRQRKQVPSPSSFLVTRGVHNSDFPRQTLPCKRQVRTRWIKHRGWFLKILIQNLQKASWNNPSRHLDSWFHVPCETNPWPSLELTLLRA